MVFGLVGDEGRVIAVTSIPEVDGVPCVKSRIELCRIELFCNREDGKVPVGCR